MRKLAARLLPLLAACCLRRARRDTAIEARHRAQPAACRSRQVADSRPSMSPRREGWPAGKMPIAAPTASRSTNLPAALIIRAGCWSCPTAMCWSPKPTARAPTRPAATSRASIQKMLMKKAGSSQCQRQPDQPASRCRRRRGGGDQDRADDRPLFAVRHGVGQWRTVRRQCRRHRRLPASSPARPASTPGRATSPTCPSGYNHHWTKSLVASPDGKLPVRRRRIEQQCRRERPGDGEGPRRDLDDRRRRPAPTASSPAACATRSGSPGTRGAAQLWTAVNERDELGNDLVPDYLTSVQRRRLLRLAVELLRPACRHPASSRRGRTWSPRRSRPTMRWARTSRRSA